MAAVGLMVCVVWAPLPLASNRPWAQGLLAMALWLLVLIYLGGATLGGHARFRGRLKHAALLLASIAGFALLIAAQLVSPSHAAAWLHTADAYQSKIYLLTTLMHFAAALLVVLCMDTAERASRLLAVVVGAGVLQAVVAVGLYSTGASYQYMFLTFDQGGRATGTFANPDHLAGYMELCLAAGLGLMLAQFGGSASPARDWRQRTVLALSFLMSGKMLLRLTLVVMVVALVMTHSRMGNGAFFLALLLVGSIVATVSHHLRRPALWLVASMVLIDVIVIGQWVGLDRVVERLEDTAQSTTKDATVFGPGSVTPPPKREESIQDRLQVPRLSLPLLARQPWFGHGGGTYYLSFAQVKPAGFPYLWDHAHNDFVEVAADTGLVGLGLLLAAATATAWRATCMLKDAEPRLKRGVGAAALMALVCMGLHSMVDFNLQIPANAMTLVVLMALVWALPAITTAATARPETSDLSQTQTREGRTHGRQPPPADLLPN